MSTAAVETPCRPILFSGPMVRAILDGRKTQTRRVVKLPLHDGQFTGCEVAGCEVNSVLRQGHGELCPYGQTGDRLWVRETFQPMKRENGVASYRATQSSWPGDDEIKWKPSIFMPRWASRITLEIVSVRVERLQDISEEDAKAEGIAPESTPHYPARDAYAGTRFHNSTTGAADLHAIESYATLWDSINGKKHPWSSNPWVWVIEFRKL